VTSGVYSVEVFVKAVEFFNIEREESARNWELGHSGDCWYLFSDYFMPSKFILSIY
jgi:hypothetical protein